MPFEIDDLPPGPDLDTVDLTGDRGNSLEAAPSKDEIAEQADKRAEEDLKEVLDKPDEDKAEEEKTDEDKARDDKGRFKGKEASIPKSRFDEAVGKERAAREAAEERLAALQAQITQNTQRVDQANEITDLEAKGAELTRQHGKLLIDGEEEKAAEVMNEIRKIDRQIVKLESSAEAGKQTAAVLEVDRYNLAVAQLEAQHPVLNPDSEMFDKYVASQVLSEQRELMAEFGLSSSKALIKAAGNVMQWYENLGKKPEPEAKEPGLKAGKDRKAESVEKNIDASKRQPASTKDAGIDSDKVGATSSLPDISQMTQEELDALPKATVARMRGDFL